MTERQKQYTDLLYAQFGMHKFTVEEGAMCVQRPSSTTAYARYLSLVNVGWPFCFDISFPFFTFAISLYTCLFFESHTIGVSIP